MAKLDNSYLQFPNYNGTSNDKPQAPFRILVYKDEEHSIYLTINNASPYGVFLVDTFNDQDSVIIGRVGKEGLLADLEDYFISLQ